MHQSFVTTAPSPHPHLLGWAGYSRANVWWGSVLSSSPRSAGLVILHTYTLMEFTVIKSRALTLSRSPQYRAFSRAVMDEKLFLLFPVGGGAGSGYKWHALLTDGTDKECIWGYFRDNFWLFLILWIPVQNYPSIITKYPPYYLFLWVWQN